MIHGRTSRRDVIKGAAASAAAALATPALAQGQGPPVVVIGGGFAGADCARTLKKTNPRVAVTLVEANPTYSACPLANAVLAGLRPLRAQQFDYARVSADNVSVVIDRAVAVDPKLKIVSLSDRTRLAYERLVIAPGIDLRFDALAGYSAAAAAVMPHAWTSGEQVMGLRDQLEAMDDGGVVVISVPVNPARCPPGPYERASMIAWYLKSKKPRSKVIVLDAKETFSLQRQFQKAWAELYPGLIEWVSLSDGGNVTEVRPATKTFVTDFDEVRADVGNVIPPQKAGAIAHAAGVADRTGWCPVDPLTFESALQRDIHVIGDAAIAGALPKSAFAAREEGRLCALALARLLDGKRPAQPKLASTCYSLVAPDYALSISGVYHPVSGQFMEVEGTGASSPVDAPRSLRSEEANFADAWFKTITREVFG
ncbi:MAG TPA: NAD(P)/FAD-dependent oxidoreductase [Xanthobacteraceae bacterium]|nr:NAD(P)/FAD-dependent oxidoreductase [Xanthobacteraceae bacterium]